MFDVLTVMGKERKKKKRRENHKKGNAGHDGESLRAGGASSRYGLADFLFC